MVLLICCNNNSVLMQGILYVPVRFQSLFLLFHQMYVYNLIVTSINLSFHSHMPTTSLLIMSYVCYICAGFNTKINNTGAVLTLISSAILGDIRTTCYFNTFVFTVYCNSEIKNTDLKKQTSYSYNSNSHSRDSSLLTI